MKSVWRYLRRGNEGGVQSLSFGSTSLDERLPGLPPPVKRTMVSSLAGPGSFVMIDDDN